MDPLTNISEHARIVIWALGSILAFVMTLFVPAIAYFLVREFTRKDRIEADTKKTKEDLTRLFNEGMDKFSDSLVDVSDAISQLKETLTEIRLWSNDKFVQNLVFDNAIKRLEDSQKAIKAEMRSEFERCREFCPYRKGNIYVKTGEKS